MKKGTEMKGKEQKESEIEKKQGFNLQIPESLYVRLKNYVENYARRHESMTFIINQALKEKLDKLEKELKK
jgi:hypothetical protein